ncbi:hypothetical protein LX32DRAFT_646745 [Colletotrichum zoysiae]|uniref:Uncharacterized protein n=1 Tax=Colletotrichum zoysiae TaxID=1216348 RepID=A0AAD9H410_9PEZI|nr:hypothetical protein LX32DRAFT_646745 [Colletotrichum zoysiae]
MRGGEGSCNPSPYTLLPLPYCDLNLGSRNDATMSYRNDGSSPKGEGEGKKEIPTRAAHLPSTKWYRPIPFPTVPFPPGPCVAFLPWPKTTSSNDVEDDDDDTGKGDQTRVLGTGTPPPLTFCLPFVRSNTPCSPPCIPTYTHTHTHKARTHRRLGHAPSRLLPGTRQAQRDTVTLNGAQTRRLSYHARRCLRLFFY